MPSSRRGPVSPPRARGRPGPGARGQQREVGADQREGCRFVGHCVVRHAALADVDARATQLLLAHRLAGGGRDQRRARREYRGLLEHDHEVAEQRRYRAVSRRGARDHRDRGHLAREPCQFLHVVGRVGMPRQRVAGALAGAVEQHDQRHAFLPRDARVAQALGVRREADRAALHREVLGADHHRAPVDAGQPAHESIGGGRGRLAVGLPAGQRAELHETARVAQRGDLLAGVQAPGRAQLRQSRLAAHGAARLDARPKLLEQRCPVRGDVRRIHQCRSCVAMKAWRTSFFRTFSVALRGRGSSVKLT